LKRRQVGQEVGRGAAALSADHAAQYAVAFRQFGCIETATAQLKNTAKIR
jgi:hypothetical protein